MRASVIVTTYNWPEALCCCLRALARQSVVPVEVIVADDGSGAPTHRCIGGWQATFPCPLLHVWQEDLGFRAARARNMGLQRSRGDYILYLDGDMIPHRHWVKDHLEAARPGYFAQGTRALIGPRLSARVLASQRVDFSVWDRDLRKRRHTLRCPALRPLLARSGDRTRGIRSCNQGYWRGDLERVNGWNEGMHGWGFEDLELAARLYNSGVHRQDVRFAALASHIHHPERRREGNNPNREIFERTVTDRLTTCKQGLAELGCSNMEVPVDDPGASALNELR